MFPFYLAPLIKFDCVSIEVGIYTMSVKMGMAYVILPDIFGKRVEKYADL